MATHEGFSEYFNTRYLLGFGLTPSTDGSSAESASSSEEIAIYTNVVTDSEWELSEGTCSEGKENFGLTTEIRKVWVRNLTRKV